MTTIGRCTRCRERTVIKSVTVKAFPNDPRPVEAELCDCCIDKTQKAVVELRPFRDEPSELTQVYV